MHITNTNVTINVKAMDASIAFYQSIGFTLKQQWGNHYAQLTAPGIELGLHPSDQAAKTEKRSGISIGFTTEDFAASKTTLEQLGIAFTERSEEGGTFLHFNDPDGTALYVIQPKW